MSAEHPKLSHSICERTREARGHNVASTDGQAVAAGGCPVDAPSFVPRPKKWGMLLYLKINQKVSFSNQFSELLLLEFWGELGLELTKIVARFARNVFMRFFRVIYKHCVSNKILF